MKRFICDLEAPYLPSATQFVALQLEGGGCVKT